MMMKMTMVMTALRRTSIGTWQQQQHLLCASGLWRRGMVYLRQANPEHVSSVHLAKTARRKDVYGLASGTPVQRVIHSSWRVQAPAFSISVRAKPPAPLRLIRNPESIVPRHYWQSDPRDNLPCVAYVVSKKTFGNKAVVRNRVKRVARAVVRHVLIPALPGGVNAVVVCRADMLTLSYQQIENQMVFVVRRLRQVLPRVVYPPSAMSSLAGLGRSRPRVAAGQGKRPRHHRSS